MKQKLIKRMLLFKDGLLIDHRPLNHIDVTDEWVERIVDVGDKSFNHFIQNRNLTDKLEVLEENPIDNEH